MTQIDSTRMIADRYQLISLIGEGGMGAVYHIVDRLTGETIALKRVLLEINKLSFNSSQMVGEVRRALAREFQTLASLRHPHIISVLDYGFDDQRKPFFTMEFLQNSQNIFEAGRYQPLDVQIDLLIQMLQALMYLHRRGILHRDLKPGNVMVTQDGVKLLDFGLSISLEELNDTNPTASGTLAYMAPEVINGRVASEASDLYAVGVIAYQLFSGRHPFDTGNFATLINQILEEEPNIDALPVSEALKAVVQRLLHKSPVERYHDAYSAIVDLCEAVNRPVPVESQAIRESFIQAARFVGRDEELALLNKALENTRNGGGASWLIGGESGVGKSRLLNEIRTGALVNGVLVVRGQALEDGSLPYQLWREPLRRLLLAVELSDLEAGILKDIVPDIALLLRRDIPDAPTLEGEATQQRLSLTIADVFRRQTVPVLLLLEDLQWAGESLAPLKQINNVIADLRLLILATYRNDEAPKLSEELPGMQSLLLKRLSKEAIEELTTSMLGEVDNSREVVDLLQRETEGNVFFLVEVVRALAEEAGRLNQVGKTVMPTEIFTGGVRQIVERRLSRVPADFRPLLNVAAIAGRQLDPALMRELLPDVDYGTFLNAAADAAVLEVQDDNWRFVHDKLREGVLAGMTRDERTAMHRQVAEGIERAYPDAADQAVRLARHWRAAGDVAKEKKYAFMAGEGYIKIGAYAEAIHFLERFVVLGRSVQATDTRLAVAMRYLGEGYTHIGAADKASDCFNEAIYYISGEDTEEQIHIYNDAAMHYLSNGNYEEAEKYLSLALPLARQLAVQDLLTQTLTTSGVLALHQQRVEIAQQFFDEVLRFGPITSQPIKVTQYILTGLFTINLWEGRFAEAKENLEQLSVLHQSHRNQWLYAATQINLGILAVHAADFSTARTKLWESMELARRLGSNSMIANIHMYLSQVAIHQNDDESYYENWSSGFRIALNNKITSLLIDAFGRKAEYLYTKGNLEEALTLAHFVEKSPVARYGADNSHYSIIKKGGQILSQTEVEKIKAKANALSLDDLVLEHMPI